MKQVNPSAKQQPGFALPNITAEKEVPNTNGVVIWPEKILNEIKMLEQFDKAQKRKEVHFNDEVISEEEDFLVEKLGFSESFEFYLMLVVVALVWWAAAYYVLKLHQFPFHKHYFEALAIFICPVLFIIVLFSLVDSAYNYFYHKNKFKKDV
mmetsp:Transcript_25561/g.43107  ORF Transcript_25561/g.43107 Transcript_25561/m.43107 type:complete len:152 (-) Transcript_25561:119-574(-)|eukprot:CAMPEP_0114452490 /NCGR_PEP_ID=MMETSP0104-20121206/1543_1 /TAXON_ID=37642 ORGANISM="Paraphysomonas imperforata, Strain PA2" /NCGR_SAMPLE_ID=MMETSP0104 /ASSEMBLY_ACC=CAM_ASM_000202 /LENGTH=151 /DNA_ID=CAMNT_0001624745 /DNA_START=73 /DNA_END=528 /DNA_ORIENTATION=+